MEHDLGAAILDVIAAAVDRSPLLVLGMSSTGAIRFANDAVFQSLGHHPVSFIGSNAIDLIHPEDIDRAALALVSATEEQTFPHGFTRYRIAASDGRWIELEVLAAAVENVDETLIVAYARKIGHQLTMDEVMSRLVADEPVDQVLTRVCDLVLWRELGSQVGIAWTQGRSEHAVSTGVAQILVDGRDDGSPWAETRRTGLPFRGSADALDDDRRGMAQRLGLVELSVVPFFWGPQEPGLVTIWTTGDGRSPEQHAFGQSQLLIVAQLVLRWTAQAEELARFARTDVLTGLANRRVFFESIEAGVGAGAVLYCDLDGFKPVNDGLGHGAGDLVLQVVAERVSSMVRPEDLVARIGGDEFAILCPGVSRADADALAERVADAMVEPIDVGSVFVTVGMSIGVSHSHNAIDVATVERADAELCRVKQERAARPLH